MVDATTQQRNTRSTTKSDISATPLLSKSTMNNAFAARIFLLLLSCLIACTHSFAWQPVAAGKFQRTSTTASTRLHLFDKLFEEEGILGKGVTVGKVQVALASPDRSQDSIFGILEREAADDKPLPELTHSICLALLRKSDEWVGAAGASNWYGMNDAGKAESQFNEWANAEAMKFEKEYIPDSPAEGGGPTIVVVSLVVEIEGDSTQFEGAGFSLSRTKEVLSSIASDCMVDDGECLNAVEIFWTPSDRSEVLGRLDVVTDFPEIIDM